MVANPNRGSGNVYMRDGEASEDTHMAWNAVIRKVNEERENPPEDTNCDELEPIDEVEEDHIWTKQDVEELREAIDEMCEFAWIEELEFWHDAILTEIDEALDRELGGWGDEEECCKAECVPDCSNAVGEEVETYIGSFLIDGCLQCQPAPVGCPDEGYCCNSAENQEARDAGRAAWTAMSEWAVLWKQYCILVSEVEDLERELEILETQLTALEEIRDEECAKEPPNRCDQRQEAVDEKQDEVDEKQDEVDEKKEERDTKQAEADAKDGEAEGAAAENMSLIQDCQPFEVLYYYGTDIGNAPLVDFECDELAPDCLSYYRAPLRCRATWSVEVKSWWYDTRGREWEGEWGSVMAGFYTKSGQPFATSVPGCTGFNRYFHAAFGEDACERFGYQGHYIYEVRVKQGYRLTTPEGEECCEEENGDG